jgi:methyl-accepting chemotaxis protein
MRLYAGFAAVLVLMLVLTIIGITKVNTIDGALTQITDVNSVKQRYAINYRGSVHDRAITVRDIVVAQNDAQVDEFLQEIDTLATYYSESEQGMQKMISSGVSFSDTEQALLAKIENIQSSTLPLIDMLVELKRNEDNELAKEILLSEARPAFSDWLAAINEFIDYQEAANQEETPVARNVAASFQNLMLIVLVLAVLASVVVAQVIIKSFLDSLGAEPYEAAESLSQISKGDLSERLHTDKSNSMLGHMANMQTNLRNIVKGIVEASGRLKNQSENVSISSQAVSNAAQDQASLTTQTTQSLDRMSTRLSEISEMVTQTQSNSVQTTEFSKNGKVAIDKSSTEMGRIADTVNSTVDQVRRLEDATKEIGNIVNVISGISEQTNLLALNAAIEAARAGETGRGFAVVADEVRQLAQRTGDATNQIAGMIAEVQNETAESVKAMERTQPLVESGKALTLETTEILQQIEEQAAKSMENVTLVATVTNEQVSSIQDVAQAMDRINSMSQESIGKLAANIEATQALNDVADELNGNVGFFKL